MWIINWLPEAFIHFIFLAGILGTIAGFVLAFIPFVSTYKLAIKIIGLILLLLGVYLEGGLSEKHKWQLRVKEMEVKIAEAQAKAEKVNTQIVEKVVTQKQIIQVKGDSVVTYIERDPGIQQANTACDIPAAAIKAHDLSAQNLGVGETQGDAK